jgi:hypothetical protein
MLDIRNAEVLYFIGNFGFFRMLSEYEKMEAARGFTRRNLFRMRQFYETYQEDKKCQHC